jgi:hypothetical protein
MGGQFLRPAPARPSRGAQRHRGQRRPLMIAFRDRWVGPEPLNLSWTTCAGRLYLSVAACKRRSTTSRAGGKYQSMLLLHISDIHFKEPDCLNPAMDPDLPYRTLILRDARERIRTLGNVGAILIGGDVAFKGDPSEFETALVWIKELAQACGCPFEKIFVVPGNHDVDWRIVDRVPAVRNARNAIINAPTPHRERELRTQFSDADTGRSLLQPLSAYNEFAKLFSCQVYSPEHLFWRQDLPIDGGVTLRLYGLTSPILSGRNDTRNGPLYVSPLQTVLEPADDAS